MSSEERAGNADAVLAPTGDLTIFEVGTFHHDLVRQLGDHSRVTIDLGRVERLDASAIQVLLAAQQSGRVTVTGVSDAIRTRFRDLGCAEHIHA